MAAAGARGVLMPASAGGGFELAVRADLLADLDGFGRRAGPR